MMHRRFLEALRNGAAVVLMASATAGSAGIPQVPDPELAWEYRDFRPVEGWLEQREGAVSDSVEGLRARAWLARRAGETERALELIDQAMGRAPASADLRVDRARFRSDLLDEAGPFSALRIARDVRDDLEHAVSVAPRHVDALVALASFHQRAPAIAGGNKHYAEALMERLKSVAPGRMHLRAAMQMARQERFDGAAARISRAIDSAERIRPKWWLRKGRWLLALNRYDQAAHCFEKALDNAPRFAPALYALGRLAAQGEAELGRGATALGRYLELPRWPGDPDHALAWLELGRIKMRLESPAEARDAFRRALELDPELNEARQALDRLLTSG
jgi:tetratricopeptide (TPR) repeat protein